MVKFAFVVDGEVGFIVGFRPEEVGAQNAERNVACLRSEPQIIEIPEGADVSLGWKYDGTSFHL